MTMQDRNPLDPQERELAALLARIRPRVEPGDDLDARILAMASREAWQPSATPRSRRHRRWPAWLGAAASLAAVAGFLWQVHPILDPSPQVAPVAAPADAGDGTGRQPIRYVEPAVATSPEATPPPPPPPRVMADRPAPRATVPPARPAPSATKAVGTDVPAPVTAKSPPPVSADIAGAPAASESVPSPPPPSAAAPIAVSGARSTHAPPSSASTTPSPPAPVRTSATEPRTSAFDERPPATTDSGEVQQAWLARIGTLKAEGRVDEARASLKEFRQRHPNAEIPPELKSLLEPPKPAAIGETG